ncbi:hypothetical protein VTH06DRAFT_7578 [Thermothelomyces fergusii]
MSRVDKI